MDKIELRGMKQIILWSELDRWNHSMPDVPIPPSYTLYTYFTLKESFIAFLIIIAVHTLTMLVVKLITSARFKTRDALM